MVVGIGLSVGSGRVSCVGSAAIAGGKCSRKRVVAIGV